MTCRCRLLVASVGAAAALCLWGAIGWRSAYRIQARVAQLTAAEELRAAQLLAIEVRAGEADVRRELDGPRGPTGLDGADEECIPASAVRAAFAAGATR